MKNGIPIQNDFFEKPKKIELDMLLELYIVTVELVFSEHIRGLSNQRCFFIAIRVDMKPVSCLSNITAIAFLRAKIRCNT